MARLPLVSTTLAPDFEATGEPRGETFSTRPAIFSIVKVRSSWQTAGGPLGRRLGPGRDTRSLLAVKSSSEKCGVAMLVGAPHRVERPESRRDPDCAHDVRRDRARSQPLRREDAVSAAV